MTTASGQQNTSAAGDRLLLKPVGGTAQQDGPPTCHPGGLPRGAREVEFGGSYPEGWEVHLAHGPDQGACEPAAGSDRPGLRQAQVPGGTQPQDRSAVWVGAGRPSWAASQGGLARASRVAGPRGELIPASQESLFPTGCFSELAFSPTQNMLQTSHENGINGEAYFGAKKNLLKSRYTRAFKKIMNNVYSEKTMHGIQCFCNKIKLSFNPISHKLCKAPGTAQHSTARWGGGAPLGISPHSSFAEHLGPEVQSRAKVRWPTSWSRTCSRPRQNVLRSEPELKARPHACTAGKPSPR